MQGSAFNPDTGSYQYIYGKPDEGLAVEFRMDSTLDDAATKENRGMPIFKDVPWVRIVVPGNRDEIIDTVAWIDDANENAHNRRFPFAWQRFQNNQSQTPSGFPLKECPWLLKSQVDTLVHHSIRTVEELANVSDGNLVNIPKGLELRERARLHLEQANSADVMRAQLMALQAELQALKQSVPSSPLMAVVPQSAEPAVFSPQGVPQAQEGAVAPKKRGRPAKAKTAVQEG